MKNSIPSKVNFPEIEELTLEIWNTQRIFQKSRDKNQGKDPYIFYDGPPFATGLPHYGHILTSYVKDTVPRYFNMKGFYVDRRWGWDCHGLPVEYEVEKKLKLSGKKTIEKYGIGNFNHECRSIVLTYAEDWENIINRIGRWVDFDHQYKTMDIDYMESVVWIFSELYKKGLIYESPKVVAYCNRCQTPLSNFETGLDDAYREKEDPAVYVKFVDSENDQISYLAWTTTPWTLPANVALAVNSDLHYVLLRLSSNEMIWTARDSIPDKAMMEGNFEIVKTCKGKDLLGKTYIPVFNYNRSQKVFRVIDGKFVEAKPGSGIVHIAASFGEDDWNLCIEEKIEPFNPVGADGTFIEAVEDFAGLDVFEANEPIIEYLKKANLLYHRETYRHSYPHCWRCDNPLIYRTISSWYVAVKKFKDDLVKLNNNINWVPHHIKAGRFGKWLEGARDWAISRNRFWGTPVPVWRCSCCGRTHVPSSIGELEEKISKKINDLHRPFCDEIKWPCPETNCEGQMERISEVLDCWFESGAMPYAQDHFPFENRAFFEKNFPASFIVEYEAQTRGWFYTLMVLSTALMKSHPSDNAICHGVILAEDGRKMSKSLNNYPDPMNVIKKYGSDALRIYLLSSTVIRGNDIRFSEKDVKEAVRRYLIPLWNVFHFYSTYARLLPEYQPALMFQPKRVEDRHILCELEIFRSKMEKAVEAYHLPKCYHNILDFIEMLSTWYVRVNRRRFWVTRLDEDSSQAFDTLYTVLVTAVKICAPFIPFTTDFIHQHLAGNSVHLEDWPKEEDDRIDEDLSSDMHTARLIVEGIRANREKNRIALRQPLAYMRICGIAENRIEPFKELIKEQGNLKEIKVHVKPEEFLKPTIQLDTKILAPLLKKDFNSVKALAEKGKYEILEDGCLKVGDRMIDSENYRIGWQNKYEKEDVWQNEKIMLTLSFDITEELRTEKTANDMNRLIQDLRKKLRLPYNQLIDLRIEATGQWLQALQVYRKYICEQSLTKNLTHNVKNPMIEKQDDEGILKVEIIPL